MLQFPLGTMTKLTGRPELAVALTVRVPPTTCEGMGLKVMVWDLGELAAVTVKLRVTGEAGL